MFGPGFESRRLHKNAGSNACVFYLKKGRFVYFHGYNHSTMSAQKFNSSITGHLDIIVTQNEDELDGIAESWNEVLIHGDPEGLRSLAKVLLALADLNQDSLPDLPIGAREHKHLRPKIELSNSSAEVIVGRLDAKGTGAFYERYIPKES